MGSNPDAKRGPLDRWAVLWGGLFYGLLAYATFSALSFSSHSGWLVAVILLLVAALGLWYGYRLVARVGPYGDLVYLAGATGLWVALLAADWDFLILGFAIFAPLCMHDLRWAAAVAVVVGGGWIWQSWSEPGGISWPGLLGALLALGAGLLMVAYVATIVRQSRERQRLIDQLERTQAELREAERQAGMLEERERLGRDIHDTLTQGFASIVMLLEAAEASLDSDHLARRHVGRALESARDNLAESRRVVWALRPEVLAEAPLPAALERLTRQLAEEAGIRADLVVTGAARPLELARETALLRVAQESLANVRKHARATEVTVTLSYMDDVALLDVQDNGVGFVAGNGRDAAHNGGMGLRAMRERMERLGGKVSVESAPGDGTTIAVHLPIHPDEAPDTASSDAS